MAIEKFIVICLVLTVSSVTQGDDPDKGFGDKLSATTATPMTSTSSSVRGPRDVSSVAYGAPPPPSSGYGPPGHGGYTPIGQQQQHHQGHHQGHHNQGGFSQNRVHQQQQHSGGSYQNVGQQQQQNIGGFAPPPLPGHQQNFHSGSHNQQYQSHHQDQQWPPQPYEFAYSVLDAPSGNDYSHRENGDGAGRVSGEYRVLLPDGRTQIVTYTATDETGFNAQVTYHGEARPAPQGGGNYYGGAGSNQGSFGGNTGFNNQRPQHSSSVYGAPQPYRK